MYQQFDSSSTSSSSCIGIRQTIFKEVAEIRFSNKLRIFPIDGPQNKILGQHLLRSCLHRARQILYTKILRKLDWKKSKQTIRSRTLSTQLQPQTVAPSRPLCVDLDGTLVKSDTLADSLLLLLRTRPLLFLRAFGWVFKGKAALKAQVSRYVSLDASRLPYNRPLLAFLEQEHGRGRSIFLVTGADGRLAEQITAYLPLFHGVLASDGHTNLTGVRKLARLRQQFAQDGFDYVGNAWSDLPVLSHAGEAMLANPHPGLAARLRSRNIRVGRVFRDRPSLASALFRALRPHQWAKNVLVIVPLLLAHTLHPVLVFRALLAFTCFCCCASASYIINDLLDLEADRHHATKRYRPFAAGDLQASTGIVIATVLLLASFLSAARLLPGAFAAWLALYLMATLGYSLALKRVALVDVVLLAGLYTLRLVAGGAATETPVSAWLAAFSVFFFFSLALVKRFSELENLREQGRSIAHGRGYLVSDAFQLRSFGTSSGYAALVVFALYINGSKVASLYRHPARMWWILPLLLFWISRVWLLASRGEMHEDPVIFALTDRMSLLIGLAVLLIAVMAAL
jgi:4-hydroxybenzoate polyprenyltransferase/phosphoserine phosphatase